MADPLPGLFISFEGLDGSGKSTQVDLLSRRLREQGRVVWQHQEPGGTAIGQQIRRVLLDPANAAMSPVTELLLMIGSQAQAAEESIRPALARHEVLITDRFSDSTLAYQGGGRELGLETVAALQTLALGALRPDLTFFIDVDLETSLLRARERNRRDPRAAAESRFEDEFESFHRRVREAYRRIAAQEPGRVRVMDGRRTPEEIAQSVWAAVAPLAIGQVDSTR